MEDKVDEICRRLRNHLESKDLIRFVNCILTTYACQRPPDLESALKVVARVKGEQVSSVCRCSANRK